MNPLRQLSALALGDLFTLIDGIEPDQTPDLTLLLKSGREIQGRPLRWETPNLLIQGNGDSATYITLSSLEGVTVHWTPEVLAKLFQIHLPEPGAKAPTRLSLKRKIQDLAQSRDWTVRLDLDSYPDDHSNLAVLDSLLTDLGRVLSAITSDEDGKIALSALRDLHIRPDSEGPRVTRDGVTVAILTGNNRGLSTKLSSAELLQAFERVL